MITPRRIVDSLQYRARALAFRIGRAWRFESGTPRPELVIRRYADRSAYLADAFNADAAAAERERIATRLEQRASRAAIDVYCEAHRGTRPFRHRDGVPIDWREGLPCSDCRLNARLRFCLGRMREQSRDRARHRVYLTEQATPAYLMATRIFPLAIGSEFVHDDARRAALADYLRQLTRDRGAALRQEDVTRLGFADGAFDAVGSFDVLEHVPDHRAALREFARVLVPGGQLTLTAPFLRDQAHSIARARLRHDGSVEHLLAPEYHGDPASNGAVLCFHHFGWSLLDELREAGFARAELVTAWSPGCGYFGAIEAIIAQR